MADVNTTITVEDVRKLALPLGTRVVAGDGLLNRTVTWATVIYPESKTASKSIQRGEMVLLSAPENNAPRMTNDIDMVRWASDMQASAVVLSENASPTAIAEANAFGMPVLILPGGSRIRMVEKSIVSPLSPDGTGGKTQNPARPAGLLKFVARVSRALVAAPPGRLVTVMVVVATSDPRTEHQRSTYHDGPRAASASTSSGVSSPSVSMIRSAADSALAWEVVVMPIVFMPASRAASMPQWESSTATQSCGPFRAATRLGRLRMNDLSCQAARCSVRQR